MNVANLLTILRFFIIPVFGFYLFREYYITATLLFLISGITDILDGYIARKYNMITAWGKLADPLADKLIQITALVLLAVNNKIPIAVLLIIGAKEMLMIIGSVMLYKKDNFVVSANWYGKMATVVFYIAVGFLIVFRDNGYYAKILIYIMVISTIFALIMYYMQTYRVVRKKKTTKKST